MASENDIDGDYELPDGRYVDFYGGIHDTAYTVAVVMPGQTVANRISGFVSTIIGAEAYATEIRKQYPDFKVQAVRTKAVDRRQIPKLQQQHKRGLLTGQELINEIKREVCIMVAGELCLPGPDVPMPSNVSVPHPALCVSYEAITGHPATDIDNWSDAIMGAPAPE